MSTSPFTTVSLVLAVSGLAMAGFGLHEAGLVPGLKPFLPETAPYLGYGLIFAGVADFGLSAWFARRKVG